MTNYGRSVLTGVCLLLSYMLLIRAFGMMNRPSDLWLYTGIALIPALLAVIPLLLRRIWRH